MIIESKSKDCDKVLPYTYMLYFNVDGKNIFYYGVRYANVRLGVTPINDIFVSYFSSSSSVNNLLKSGIKPFKVVIHKTFSNHKDACEYEVKFLIKINARHRKDFLNLTNRFDNSLPNNAGRVMSDEARKNIGKASIKNQSSSEYRERRSIAMKAKWKDPSFIEKMKSVNTEYVETGKSKDAGKKSGNSRIGLKYNDEVKSKRSEALKRACAKIDMKARANSRKRYNCPICELSNLPGAQFNRHMIHSHKWSKENCDEFKFLGLDSHILELTNQLFLLLIVLIL